MISETQIIECWKDSITPFVSIICITYNHEQYITEAIKSFLMQKTTFSFEVIIQDDASTDNTPAIIKKYAKKFPNIIKPIFNVKNRFSQPRKNVLLLAVPHAKGQYIALCEGDDFWTDPNKLHIQITAMMEHSYCDVSFHPVWRQNISQKDQKKIISRHIKSNHIFHTKDLILGSGGFCPTVSRIFKKNIFENIPDWFLDVPVGDYFLQILGSLNGGALYIDKAMAVYRCGTHGSWTERMGRDENFVYDYYIRMQKSLQDMNIYLSKKYTYEFNIIQKKMNFHMSVHPVLSTKRKKEIYKTHKKQFSLLKKIFYYVVVDHPKFLKLLHTLKQNVRNYLFKH